MEKTLKFESMGDPQEIKRYTLAEYLEMEESAEYKSEYYNGEIYAMAGGTPKHSQIVGNCIYSLKDGFEDFGCNVYDSSLMVQVEKLNIVLYPDVSVLCGPIDSDPSSPNLVRNPSLILEVLSKGTAKYDRGSKFMRYQLIPSLRTYVMVEQHEPRVYVGYKNAQGDWGFSDYFGLEAVVELTPHGVSVPMATIYKRIDF
jgi:Uma2 family endonuclease